MKLSVPYYSQFLDVTDPQWMPRACSVVCLKMMLGYYDMAGQVSIDALIQEGISIEPYTSLGWRQDTIIALAERHGLSLYREEGIKETGVEKIATCIKSGVPVLASAIKHLLGQTKYHMVVIVGIEEKQGELAGFYYHDPESLDPQKGAYIYVGTDVFRREWRGMAIFPK